MSVDEKIWRRTVLKEDTLDMILSFFGRKKETIEQGVYEISEGAWLAVGPSGNAIIYQGDYDRERVLDETQLDFRGNLDTRDPKLKEYSFK